MENEQAITALAALAQGTRLDTFRLLVKHEPGGVPAGELARLLAVPQNTLSAHLSILSRAGLVKGERHSRSIIYRADLETFQKLTLFMIRDCCGGSAELCAPLIESLQPCCPPETPGAGKSARGKRTKVSA
jgi:DNA-binding transcriptional ArsR family regulator